jgi:glycosyltransferase involved in cell wall biosynthesis
MNTSKLTNKILAVNGQRLNLERCGGAGRYGEQLYQRMQARKNENDFQNYTVHHLSFHELMDNRPDVVNGRKNGLDFVKYAVSQYCPPIFFNYIVKFYQTLNQRLLPASNKHTEEPLLYPFWFHSESSVLLHELTNYGMCEELGRLSLCYNFNLLVSFLDIQDYYYPDFFSDSQLTKRRMAYSLYKDRADFFIAISEFTKQTMVERLEIDPGKIKVIPLAADDMLIITPSQDVEEWVRSFGRFWIYPAKPWKHKNHDFLLRSLATRKVELKRVGIKLLLTGGFAEEDLTSFNGMLEEYSLGGIVEILGFVTDEQLQALLKQAEYLVFPSLFEGFGMPILEAMTLGCPVLSSNAGSLPEVGRDAVKYFDPECEDEFIALMDAVIKGDGVERETMIEKGFANCKRFSWDRTYQETVSVYKMLL